MFSIFDAQTNKPVPPDFFKKKGIEFLAGGIFVRGDCKSNIAKKVNGENMEIYNGTVHSICVETRFIIDGQEYIIKFSKAG